MTTENLASRACAATWLLLAIVLVPVIYPTLGLAQIMGPSSRNPEQIAILHWYNANLTTTFSVGTLPAGIAFDGANMWVANEIDRTVTKLRANDGTVLGTFNVGQAPNAVAFDGANIWVANANDNTVSKLRASDGKGTRNVCRGNVSSSCCL
jgi:uncharacterized membrane protein YbhN (UPF0104 family)